MVGLNCWSKVCVFVWLGIMLYGKGRHAGEALSSEVHQVCGHPDASQTSPSIMLSLLIAFSIYQPVLLVSPRAIAPALHELATSDMIHSAHNELIHVQAWSAAESTRARATGNLSIIEFTS
jgi:hypothetical protein